MVDIHGIAHAMDGVSLAGRTDRSIVRDLIAAHPLHTTAGTSAANDRVLVVRVLAPMVESAMALLRQIWRLWRGQLWDRTAEAPRIWAT